MMPEEARSTVLFVAVEGQEKPARKARLFLSSLNDWESGLAAKTRESGTSKRS